MTSIGIPFHTSASTARFNEALFTLVPTNGFLAKATAEKNLTLASLILDIQSVDSRDGFVFRPCPNSTLKTSFKQEALDTMFDATQASFFCVAAATRFNNRIFFMLPMAGHGEIAHDLFHFLGAKPLSSDTADGFLAVDSQGRWLFKERKEAFVEAVRNGQIRRKAGTHYYQGLDLRTEDLF